MLSDEEKSALKRSWRLILPIAETAADLFYRRLFELDPSLRALFSADMAAQKRKLMHTLHFIVRSLDWPASAWEDTVDDKEDLVLVVLALGRRHRQLYRVQDAHYDTVAEALLWALEQGLGEAFTTEVRHAWTKTYTLVALLMKTARDAGSMETPDLPGLPGEYSLPQFDAEPS